MRTCTVFIHHQVDDVTVDHWKRCGHFSDHPVATVSATDHRLPHGACLSDWPDDARWYQAFLTRYPNFKAKATDLLFLAWFRNRPFDAERYFIVEWDTLVNCSIESWLRPVERFDLAAPSIRTKSREPEWGWFECTRYMQSKLVPYAIGIVPFTCVQVSHRAMERISAAYPDDPGAMNGEIRFPTIAASQGIVPVANPSATQTISWQSLRPIGLAEDIYHPIKKRILPAKPWMQETELAALERLLNPDDHVLEFGSGGSTFWLSERVRQVTTIEHSADWIQRMLPVPKNVNLKYVPPAWPHKGFEPAEPNQFADYVRSGDTIRPDVVLVDGRDRVACAKRWAGKATTILHDCNRPRYGELKLRRIVGELALVEG
jgi:hypothetical protein